MTGTEITNCLKNVIEQYGVDCNTCQFKTVCRGKTCPFRTAEYALDLINRQNAEIERLCAELDELIVAKDLLFDEAEALIKKAKALIKKARAEAVKEFAERLKEKAETEAYDDIDPSGMTVHYEYQMIDVEDVDNLVKKMVGDGE